MKRRPRVLLAVLALVGSPSLAQAAEHRGAEPLWHEVCAKPRDGQQACAVEQFAIVMPQHLVVAHIRFAEGGPKDAARMILTVPLGVLLAQGVRLSIDGSKPIELPFERCTGEGCEASAMLDKSALEKFARGGTLMVRYAGSATATANIPIRLQGLADALKHLPK